MNVFSRILTIISVIVFLAVSYNCSSAGSKELKTESQVVSKEPSIEELRKPVAKDNSIYKATQVIKKLGRLSKEYLSYEKYKKLTSEQGSTALDPDWFYDSYALDLNREGYWATVTFGTAKRAIEREPGIQKLMVDLPEKSIFMKLKTPTGRTFLLSDANADGVLDFAKDAHKKTDKKIDVKLLDKMQEKYTWIIGIIKKHFRN